MKKLLFLSFFSFVLSANTYFEIKEQTKATVTFSKPTFSPAPKPFSPETEKQKNKNAKKQPKKHARSS